MKEKTIKLSVIALAVSAVCSASPVLAQQQQAEEVPENIERIVTLGSRVNGRTATESASPVDIISSE